METGVRLPQAGGDAQVADTDEDDGGGVQDSDQREVVRMLQRRRRPALDTLGDGE